MYLILLVSQKGFLSGKTQASSETPEYPRADFQGYPKLSGLNAHLPAVSLSPSATPAPGGLKSGLGEAGATH